MKTFDSSRLQVFNAFWSLFTLSLCNEISNMQGKVLCLTVVLLEVMISIAPNDTKLKWALLSYMGLILNFWRIWNWCHMVNTCFIYSCMLSNWTKSEYGIHISRKKKKKCKLNEWTSYPIDVCVQMRFSKIGILMFFL